MAKTYSLEDYLNIKRSFAPSFSPDNELLAYLSNESGVTQLYLTDREGSSHQQLTDAEDRIEFARFSPTDNKIIYGQSSGGNEKTQLYVYDVKTQETQDLTEKPEVNYIFGNWSRDGRYIAYVSTERNGTDFDVYVMDLSNRESRCVFSPGGYCVAYSFSPQNTYLIATKVRSNFDNDLYLIDLATDKSRHLTPHHDAATYTGSAWLPDEAGFYLISNQGQDQGYLAYYDLEADSLTTALDAEHEPETVCISDDGEFLCVGFNQDGYAIPHVYNAATLKEVPLDLPDDGLATAAWSRDGRYLVYQYTNAVKNKDIYVLDTHDKQIAQITHSTSPVPSEHMVAPRLINYESFDGLHIPAFIYEPEKTEENHQRPVIIDIHGGPEGQSRPDLDVLTQYFVSRDYTVILPNVRGSSGYGKYYMALDDVDKRLDSLKDIVALHDYVKELDGIDENRIALMGGSYGGYMVLAGLAFYPECWAAGVDNVGIANVATFLENTSSYRRALREMEYGSLENDRELLESISPSNYAENIQAPLFIIHGANDPRVPLSEAELIKDKVEANGQKVEMLVYEDEGHGLAKLKNRLDAYPRVVEFLDSVLKE